VDAITLVFGSAKRGVDIPSVTPEFETNVPGIFIAGELGGMGLIHKAAQQGRAAIRSIRKRIKPGPGYDVVIVGSGPAGLSAGLSAHHLGLRYLLIEQEDALGGAIAHYPRQKITMTASVELDLVGKVNFGQIPKEQLIKFWKETVHTTGLKISFRECLQSIDKSDEGFVVHTTGGEHRTKTVLLALGRQGTPRKLGVPGENGPQVTYRLVDAAQYAGKAVLVVGGGDSALEAAIALSQIDSITVTLAYRREAFTRVKSRNRELLKKQEAHQRVQVLMQTDVTQIEAHQVRLQVAGVPKTLPCDATIVCAGGLLPTALLQKVGIEFQTKFGTA
jgi:thioredoxin reductase